MAPVSKRLQRMLRDALAPPRWFLWDPAGLIIAGFAWCIMVASLLATWVSISHSIGLLSPLGLLSALWFTALLGMCMWSHVVVMTTNPATVPASLSGIAPSAKQDTTAAESSSSNSTVGGDDDLNATTGTHTTSDDDDDDEYDEEEVEMPLHELESHEDDGTLLLFCDECGIYRPSRPWVNNCVGIGNQKAFLLLLLYVTTTSVHLALFVLAQRTLCRTSSSSESDTCGFGDNQVPGRIGLWSLAGASVFGLFCSLMLAMELYSIHLEALFTRIADQLTSRRSSKSRSRLERHLSVICGTNGFDASWLVPTLPRRSHRETAIVHGFRNGSNQQDERC